MKTISFISLIVLILILPLTGFGQINLNPNGQQLYYACTFAADRSYAANTTDTLPNSAINTWWKSTVQSYRLGAASYITLQIVTLDSMYAIVYIDELIGAVWTNVLTDSILTAVAYTQEFSVRSQNAEKTAKLGGKFRARINFPAWHTQGVVDATDSPICTIKGLWKP